MKAWGCDPAFRRLALAGVEDGSVLGSSYASLPGTGDLAADLSTLSDTTQAMAYALQIRGGNPDVILVEQPSGKFANLNLTYATGVIIASLARYGQVFTYPSQSWRKAAFGKGGLRTADAKVAAMDLAHELGYTGDNEDESEAICIAHAAVQITTIGEA